MNEPPQPPSLTPSYNERAKELQRVFAKFQEEVLLVVIGAYNAGRNEATAQLRDRLSGVLSAPLGDAQKVPSAGAKIAAQGKRAPRGTVRPAILAALKAAPHGLTVREVAEATRLNENSVRGALNAFEGEVTKRKDKWHLAPQK